MARLGEMRPHPRDHGERVGRLGPGHGREHLRMHVLRKRDVEVGQKRPARPGQKGQQRVRDPGRIEVEQAQPLAGKPGKRQQLFQQPGQPVLEPQIPAVGGHVLGHHHQFRHALVEQGPGLVHQGRHGPAGQGAADGRDGAIAAGVVAALGDLEIGIRGRGARPAAGRRGGLGPKGRGQAPGQQVEFRGAVPRRPPRADRPAGPRRTGPAEQPTTASTGLEAPSRMAAAVSRMVRTDSSTAGGDERAGVDEHEVGRLGRIHGFGGKGQAAEQDFGIPPGFSGSQGLWCAPCRFWPCSPSIVAAAFARGYHGGEGRSKPAAQAGWEGTCRKRTMNWIAVSACTAAARSSWTVSSWPARPAWPSSPISSWRPRPLPPMTRPPGKRGNSASPGTKAWRA